jgi:hypothetical protein
MWRDPESSVQFGPLKRTLISVLNNTGHFINHLEDSMYIYNKNCGNIHKHLKLRHKGSKE